MTRQSWLPSVWLSRGLVALMVGQGSAWPWLAGLGVGAVAAFAAAYAAALRFYRVGWSQAQTAEERATHRTRHAVGRPRAASSRWAVVRKDLLLFYRQPMQWYQAALGAIVMVMVLLNFSGQQRSALSAYMISLVMGYVGASTFAMNLGLRGVSKEGLCWWIVQTSPLSNRDILYAKVLTALIPTSIYATAALIGMHAILHLPWYITALSSPLLWCMSGAMIVMDVAIGIWRTDFKRAAETRNADVPAVLTSQLANYAFLSPGLFLLSLPPLLSHLDLEMDLATMVLASVGVFIPLSAVAALLAGRYALAAIGSLRLDEPTPFAPRLRAKRSSPALSVHTD
ncbi:MAG: hypothetical protein FJZ90_16100 [Chloroflexi bacterium]|nr:hypothetical protein [Chloroflexota bacterium]